jgi:hypothetical protein
MIHRRHETDEWPRIDEFLYQTTFTDLPIKLLLYAGASGMIFATVCSVIDHTAICLRNHAGRRQAGHRIFLLILPRTIGCSPQRQRGNGHYTFRTGIHDIVK